MVKFINISLCCVWLPLLMAIAWCTCPAQTRLCGLAGMKDDRIIFPSADDKDKGDTAWYETNSSSSNNFTVNGSTIPMIPLATTNNSNAQVVDLLPFSNITIGFDKLAMNDTEDADTTTIIPIVQNRIIFDTEPKCRQNFSYVGNRCRKRA